MLVITNNYIINTYLEPKLINQSIAEDDLRFYRLKLQLYQTVKNVGEIYYDK